MFIYSNHYLIISKLIQEDCPNYLNGPNLFILIPEDDCVVFDDFSYTSDDYIDLAVYEFESSDFVIIKKDNLESEDNKRELFGEQDENISEYYNYDKIINDQLHRSMNSDPFFTHDWSYIMTLYAKILPDHCYETPEDKEKDIYHKESMRAGSPALNIPYTDEDLSNSRIFPKDDKFVYYLNENTYEYIAESDDFEEEGDDFNHFIPQEFCLELDSNDFEYWHEPLFVFSGIRETHFTRPETDTFSELYTSPINEEWFNTGEFDNSADRHA